MSSQWLLLLLVLFLQSPIPITSAQARQQSPLLVSSNHTNNHAVILSSSRFWHNYRHAVNALSIYKLLTTVGNIPHENIVLMIADEYAINPRNPFKNRMYHDVFQASTVQIDYRGEDVTVENFRRVLWGTQTRRMPYNYANNVTAHQHPPPLHRPSASSRRRVLHTDSNSNILIYWTGHGGNSFFKFQDVEEITSMDLKYLIQGMQYHSILLVADTCQAFTLGDHLKRHNDDHNHHKNEDVPNVYMIGSSLKSENSYAHHTNADLGLSVIERYTHHFMEFIKKQQNDNTNGNILSQLSLSQAMVEPFDYRLQGAHVGVLRTAGTRPLGEVPLSDFFAHASSETRQPPQRRLPTTKTSTPTHPQVTLIPKPNMDRAMDWTQAWTALSV